MEKIYIAKSRNEYKIGVSVNPKRRIKELKTGNPNIELIYESIEIANAYKIEKELHKMYKSYNVGGEWFSSEISEKFEVIKEYIKNNSIYVIKKNENQTQNKVTSSHPKAKFLEDKIKELKKEVDYIHEENETIQNFLNAFNGLDIENRVSNCIYRVLFNKTIYELRDELKPKHYESFKNCLERKDLQKVISLEKIAAQLIIDYVPIDEIEEIIEDIASTF